MILGLVEVALRVSDAFPFDRTGLTADVLLEPTRGARVVVVAANRFFGCGAVCASSSSDCMSQRSGLPDLSRVEKEIVGGFEGVTLPGFVKDPLDIVALDRVGSFGIVSFDVDGNDERFGGRDALP